MSSSSAPIVLSGRPRRMTPTIEWKIKVPADVAVLVEEALPGRGGKTKYGARSELLELLLRRWLDENTPMGGFDSPSRPPEEETSTLEPAGLGSSPPTLSDKDFTR